MSVERPISSPEVEPPAVTRRKVWWRVTQIVFLGVAFVFIARAVSANWLQFKASAGSVHPNWLMLLSATAIVLATYAVLIQSWRILISGATAYGGVSSSAPPNVSANASASALSSASANLPGNAPANASPNASLSFAQAVRIWTIANLGRYIPGKVASIAALGVLAEREGVSGSTAAASAIIGTLINIGAGFGVVAITGSGLMSGLPEWFRWACWVGTGGFVVGVIALPRLLPAVMKWLATRMRRPVPLLQMPPGTLWKAVTINVLSWFSYGWAFMVFSWAILPETAGTFAQFVAAWAASYLIGYLALVAPGGLIVRETALVGALVAFGIADFAAGTILAVTSRLWLSVLELLPGLLALGFSARKRSPGSKVA